MRGVDIVLLLHVLDIDAHAFFGKRESPAANVLGGLLLDIVDAEVDLVAQVAQAADDGEQNDKWDELAVDVLVIAIERRERKMEGLKIGTQEDLPWLRW